MVRTIKDEQEFTDAWNGNVYSITGVIIKLNLLEKLKDSHKFRNLRNLIKELEVEGNEIIYYCCDLSGQKGLYFGVKENPETHKRIKNGLNELLNIESDKVHIHSNARVGTPTCCPYFG